VTIAVSPDGLPALVLNADYRPLSYYPLSLWSWQDAIKAVFLNRVNIVAEYDHEVSSPSFSMRLPSVVCIFAGQVRVSVLRDRRGPYFRPCDSAALWWSDNVGECRGCVLALQPTQGRVVAGSSKDVAAPGALPADRARVAQ
jgi:hypothetical protein